MLFVYDTMLFSANGSKFETSLNGNTFHLVNWSYSTELILLIEKSKLFSSYETFIFLKFVKSNTHFLTHILLSYKHIYLFFFYMRLIDVREAECEKCNRRIFLKMLKYLFIYLLKIIHEKFTIFTSKYFIKYTFIFAKTKIYVLIKLFLWKRSVINVTWKFS